MKVRLLFTLCYGLLAGLLLSALRAPVGLDLTQVPAADGVTAAVFRAGALFAVALFLDPARPLFRRDVPVATLLGGGFLGYALHGLVLATLWEPGTRIGFTLLLLGGTALLFLVSRGGDAPAREEAGEGNPPAPPVTLGDRLALLLLGAGSALALENLARHLRLMALGMPEDDTVLGLVLLLALLVGAVAFGRPLARPGRRRAVVAAGLVLGVGSTLVGLHHLGGLVDGGLYRYLRLPFGLDESLMGTLAPTALIAGASFCLPGFLTGAGLAAAAAPRRLSSLLLGGAVGTVLVPFVIDLRARSLDWAEAGASPWSFQLVAAGLLLAGAGGVLFCLREPGKRARFAGLGLCLAGAAVPFLVPHPSVWPITPWWPAPLEPLLVRPLPEGLLTVETVPGGSLAVTLDRRRLTPVADEETMDEDRLRWSLSLLPEDRRAGAGPRVLFVGQMTPARAAVFASREPLRLERTAPWYPALQEVEERLFAGESDRPRGPAIPPAEARRRLRAGNYDLVLVAPIHGPLLSFKSAQKIEWGTPPAPATTGWSVPAGTLAVVWIDGAAPASHRDLGERVILSVGPTLEELSVGVVLGEPVLAPAADRPALLDPGPATARPSALSILGTRGDERVRRTMAALTARLAARGEGPTRALQIHFAAQRRSSPYESRAQQIEFERAELEALQAACTTPLDATSRRIWEAEAWLLREKREIEDLVLFVEPVARKYGPWPPLDRAAARAWEEFDEPEEACFFLERLVAARPHDIDLLVEAATWFGRAGRHEEAIRQLRHALELQDPTVEESYNAAGVTEHNRLRLLGMNLVRIGDPEGRAILEGLLEKNPHDDELLEFVTDGPPPALPEGFQPPGGLDDRDP